jgi:hypothetical protein
MTDDTPTGTRDGRADGDGAHASPGGSFDRSASLTGLSTSRRRVLYGAAVAGAAATMISAFITDFDGTRSLLMVNSGLTTFGYLFVMYSLVTYD